VRRVSARDIERFVGGDPRYKAQSALKLSTNLNYLYQAGRLRDFTSTRVERWWVDALFLALDRIIEDRKLDGSSIAEVQYAQALDRSGFHGVSGKKSVEKDLATRHLTRLYIECGGRERFSEESVRERTQVRVGDMANFLANDPRPRGAVHPSNPRILKSIPRACAMLAVYAGFEDVDPEEMEAFDAEAFIRRHTERALSKLRDDQVRPTMTAEELMKITRGQ
jgi:hypothetical protein